MARPRDIPSGLIHNALEGDDFPGRPPWKHENGRLFSGLVGVAEELRNRFLEYIVFHSRENYLRHRGVRLGTDCEILNRSGHYGSEPWLIEIGNRVTITEGVVFLTHDGASRLFRQVLPYASPFGNRFGTIQIFDNCFIGVNTILMPNIKIGPNSIVGAGSVVNRDVPPNTVYAGVPARQVATLDEYIERYQAKMVCIEARDRDELRRELTQKLWGEVR